jgi:hypothetical protein
VYFAVGRLPPIYLLDAVVELVFCLSGLAWLRAERRDREAC